RQRPTGGRQEVKPLQEQQGEQSCPNLDAQGVLAGADEALDLEVLFEGLEEELDLPAVAVDVGQGGGGKLQMVGQDLDLTLLLGVPDHDASQQVGTLFRGSFPAKTNDLIGQNGTISGQAANLLHLIG